MAALILVKVRKGMTLLLIAYGVFILAGIFTTILLD